MTPQTFEKTINEFYNKILRLYENCAEGYYKQEFFKWISIIERSAEYHDVELRVEE